jgi:hypothetical protein
MATLKGDSSCRPDLLLKHACALLELQRVAGFLSGAKRLQKRQLQEQTTMKMTKTGQ